MIRIILAIVAAANFCLAYLFFLTPEVFGQIYQLQALDNAHMFLTMTVGGMFAAFGLGALLAFFRPIKYGSIIIMLLIMHFTVFLVDVIVLARGQMPWKIIVPEMIYFLVVSTALVRWYPVRRKEAKEAKEKEEAKDVGVVEGTEGADVQ